MVITVTCPSCAASFPVDTNKIPAAGVKARCSSCRHVFRVERPKESAPPPPRFEAPVVQAAPAPRPAEYEPEPEPELAYEPEPEPAPEPLPTFETPSYERFDGVVGLRDEAPGEGDFSIGSDAAAATEPVRDWVFEQEPQIDASSLDIRPMDTVESSVEEARKGESFFRSAEDFGTTDPFAGTMEVASPEPPAAPQEPEHPAVGSFTFGKRDPKDKARRLARVLVSDMIMYNPDRHERALANGTLRQDFEDEIAKSWKEYVDQVGKEMATENPFWADALNDVLAKGEKIF
ncbi:MAG: zinc-ribbon domain-containing protein [Longimicrobiales bacterium]|nr:zinc-ribbon domain-containing protein [Longimicrobiales bacterium]